MAKIAEEKAEAEKEREALQLNCEQHQQLERQQHETGRKVGGEEPAQSHTS